MARISHGSSGFVSRSDIINARTAHRKSSLFRIETATGAESTEISTGYEFMFPALQSDPENRLPEGDETIKGLIALAAAMSEAKETRNDRNPAGDAVIPVAYTYLGQFIDHDITKEDFVEGSIPADVKDVLRTFAAAGPFADASQIMANARTGALDLDSVYEAALLPSGLKAPPRHETDPNRMLIGTTTEGATGRPPLPRIPNKDLENDVPRNERSSDAKEDRAAKIGDPRNDENLVISQLHLAFLRAHNAIVVDQNKDFDAARLELGNLYLDIVMNDFLARISDPEIREDVMTNGRRFWAATGEGTGNIPIEFTLAAYRFGHSMVRAFYNYNVRFDNAPFSQLFSFARLKGTLGIDTGTGNNVGEGFDTVPQNWVIQWERFFEIQMARKIDTFITPPVNRDLPPDAGQDLPKDLGDGIAQGMKSLGERNLLRGYALGLPHGQAVAAALGETALSGDALLAALPEAVRDAAAPFEDKTPLWFYILAEAGNPDGPNGHHLGRVGSRIVCETLHALAQASDFDMPDFSPEPTGSLKTLLRLSGNFDDG